jgi:CBS domain-containing protein
MSRDVVTVTPETPLKDVAARLAENRIAGVPVCDRAGRVLGVVSEADILWKEIGLSAERGGLIDWILNAADRSNDRIAARTAGDAMTSPAVTVSPSTPVAAAAKLMLDKHVNRLPVVEDERLVGIIARADLVRAFQRSDEEIEREIREDVLLHTLWVAPEAIRLGVSGGQVTLAGQVENRTTAELIEAYVRRVPGVIGLRSELAWQLDDLARRAREGADRLPRKV